MKNKLPLLLFLSIASIAQSQVVGYQGKRFIAEIGYAPANNVTAILFNYNLADDYYSNDPDNPGGKDPIIFRHIPKVELEYVITRYGSVFFRYNPFSITSNLEYFNDITGQSAGIVGAESKGSMVSLGYRQYRNGNIAPLGSYLGVYLTSYSFKNAFVESKYSEDPVPESFLNYTVEDDKMFGLFAEFGVKLIYWDKLVVDLQADGGYFFKNLDDYSSAGYGDSFDPYILSTDQHIVYYTATNTRAFYFLVPSVNVGFLVF